MTASTPRSEPSASRTTGIPPPPLATTTYPASTSDCTAGASRISSGSGEATTRRQPFSPRSSHFSPCSTRRIACSAGRNRPIGLVGVWKPGSSASTSARVTSAAVRRSSPRSASADSSAFIRTKPSVAWVCAPHQSSGTGGTTAAASSFLTSRLPTWGPLPCVITTSTSWASRSATAAIATWPRRSGPPAAPARRRSSWRSHPTPAAPSPRSNLRRHQLLDEVDGGRGDPGPLGVRRGGVHPLEQHPDPGRQLLGVVDVQGRPAPPRRACAARGPGPGRTCPRARGCPWSRAGSCGTGSRGSRGGRPARRRGERARPAPRRAGARRRPPRGCRRSARRTPAGRPARARPWTGSAGRARSCPVPASWLISFIPTSCTPRS